MPGIDLSIFGHPEGLNVQVQRNTKALFRQVKAACQQHKILTNHQGHRL